MLGWRKDPTLAFDRHTGALVESNSGVVGSASAGIERTAWLPPTGAAFDRSRTFDFGGCFGLIERGLGPRPLELEIPSIVTDTMLRRIVEAHFAVWYVWHVQLGSCIVPGMRELLDIPDYGVPTIVEEWLERVHPDDLPRMVAENDEALRVNARLSQRVPSAAAETASTSRSATGDRPARRRWNARVDGRRVA